MGSVYLVRDLRLQRLAALKVMRKPDDRALRRFQREAIVTARLDHPGIPPVYDVGRSERGEAYLLMRYLPGKGMDEPLQELHRAGVPGLDVLRPFIAQLARVCEAVAYAHGRGIVHRDLKPANVFLGSFGEVCVADWGLCRDLHESQDQDAQVQQDLLVSDVTAPPSGVQLTQEGAMLGTLGYMPPEQARAEDVDPRCDVFSLGAILCDVLTGLPPFQGGTAGELIAATGGDHVTYPDERRADLDPDLVAVARRALAPAQGDRYPDANALARDLRSWLAGRPVAARHYGPARRALWAVRSNPAPYAVLGAAFLALVGVLGAWVTTARAQRAAEVQQARAALRATAEGDAEAPLAGALRRFLAAERWHGLDEGAESSAAYREAALELGAASGEVAQWPVAVVALEVASALSGGDERVSEALREARASRDAAANRAAERAGDAAANRAVAGVVGVGVVGAPVLPAELDRAVAALEAGLAEAPGHPRLLAELGRIQGVRGDHDRARRAAEAAAEAAPDDPNLLYARAVVSPQLSFVEAALAADLTPAQRLHVQAARALAAEEPERCEALTRRLLSWRYELPWPPLKRMEPQLWQTLAAVRRLQGVVEDAPIAHTFQAEDMQLGRGATSAGGVVEFTRERAKPFNLARPQGVDLPEGRFVVAFRLGLQTAAAGDQVALVLLAKRLSEKHQNLWTRKVRAGALPRDGSLVELEVPLVLPQPQRVALQVRSRVAGRVRFDSVSIRRALPVDTPAAFEARAAEVRRGEVSVARAQAQWRAFGELPNPATWKGWSEAVALLDDGIRDWSRVLEARPDDAWARWERARATQLRARWAVRAGEDPRSFCQRTLDDLTWLLERRPAGASGRGLPYEGWSKGELLVNRTLVWQYYGEYRRALGGDAVVMFRRAADDAKAALELDPNGLDSVGLYLGNLYQVAKHTRAEPQRSERLRAVVAQARASQRVRGDMKPGHPYLYYRGQTHMYEGLGLHLLGDREGAVRAFRAGLRFDGDRGWIPRELRAAVEGAAE
jgi:tetratricopeptide (TPR) repeat protein/tRNA A-37 threonylcarbamoyl transferase component Bud32